jgi:hypothetical protein
MYVCMYVCMLVARALHAARVLAVMCPSLLLSHEVCWCCPLSQVKKLEIDIQLGERFVAEAAG